MKFKYLLIGTSLSLIPQTINAQCVATQDCATLGYTETSCSGGSGVKCPFGNKWACFKSESEICNDLGFTLSCNGTNQTGGGGKDCNGKYSECTCASGYKWDTTSGTCVADRAICEVGTLYYSDNTCSADYNACKTLLGVVIYSNGEAGGGWIMTITPIQIGLAWDTGSYYSTGITDKDINASCTNTKKLVDLGSRFAAADAANNYKPAGTPSGKNWCLPSYDLLNNINNSTNFAKVNAGISLAGGTKIGFGTSYYDFENVWSSSEESANNAWYFNAYETGLFRILNNLKYYITSSHSYTVRPVMEF